MNYFSLFAKFASTLSRGVSSGVLVFSALMPLAPLSSAQTHAASAKVVNQEFVAQVKALEKQYGGRIGVAVASLQGHALLAIRSA